MSSYILSSHIMQTEGINNNVFLLVLFPTTCFVLASSLAASFLKFSLQPSFFFFFFRSIPHKSLSRGNLSLGMPEGGRSFSEWSSVILQSRARVQGCGNSTTITNCFLVSLLKFSIVLKESWFTSVSKLHFGPFTKHGWKGH